MIIPLFFNYLILISLSLATKEIRNNGIITCFVTLSLILIATFRSTESPDYENFLELYDFEFEYKEIGYLYLIKVGKSIFNSPLSMFFLSALMSISLKIFVIEKISPFFFISLVVYVSNIFILHDMIQMRCAIASGFIMWAVYYYCKGKNILSLLISLVSILFHYSAIIIFVVYLFDKSTFNRRVAITILFGSFLIASLGLRFGNLWSYITFGEFARLWDTYSQKMESGEMDQINIYNAFFLVRVFVCTLLVFSYKKIISHGSVYVVALKMYVFSICIFLLFSDVPVLAFRLSELFQVVEVVLFPSIVFLFKNHTAGKLFVITLASLFIMVNIFYNELVL